MEALMGRYFPWMSSKVEVKRKRGQTVAVLCLVRERTSTVRPRIITICYHPNTWAGLVGAYLEAAVCHSLLSRSTHDDRRAHEW